MIAGIILYLITYAYDLYTDTMRSDADINRSLYVIVNHFRGSLLRLVMLIPAHLLMGWSSIGLIFTYWAAFDIGYAIRTSNPLNYIGTTAKLDQLQRKLPWLQNTKLILAVIGLLIFIVL